MGSQQKNTVSDKSLIRSIIDYGAIA